MTSVGRQLMVMCRRCCPADKPTCRSVMMHGSRINISACWIFATRLLQIEQLRESCGVANPDPWFAYLLGDWRRMVAMRAPECLTGTLVRKIFANKECYNSWMLKIRRAFEADVEALSPLKATVHEQHVKDRPDFFKPMRPEDVDTWLRRRLGEEATHVWLAEDCGILAGYVLATRRQREETPYSLERQWCEIDEIVVAPSYRQRGVARALMARAIAHAHELGLDAIELSTWAFNEHAHTAFARLGFRPMLVRYQLGTDS